MDGLSVSLPVDSACTSAEVCQALAKKVNLKDIYGFSLYIGFCEKVRIKSYLSHAHAPYTTLQWNAYLASP